MWEIVNNILRNHDEIDKIEVEVQTWIQLKHMLKNGSVKTVNRGRYVANNPKIKVALNKIHLPESYRETDFVPLKVFQNYLIRKRPIKIKAKLGFGMYESEKTLIFHPIKSLIAGTIMKPHILNLKYWNFKLLRDGKEINF